MNGIRDHFGLHDDALALRSKRNNILASNIANAATPHFKARDLDFEATLAKAMPVGPIATTNNHHINRAASSPGNSLGYRTPINPSLDGNTVELAVEQMEFSENVIHYQTSLTFLNRKISGLMSAIKGE
ncbi:flagellar basal body rod protein FlgB [Sulfitobacter sp.]|nr:flagellar basal body rod protein FlgB [bacterium]MDC0135576.1 flagellar basal body rod protein FlgB [Sulfitobacter sp.]|tara:strand:+ start:139 stop:525 length:387 start_codon:yes stop_codon:yes gene_type:complete